jgi:hypothetical protein
LRKILFESKQKLYNPKFIAKIQKSREDLKAGKGRIFYLNELDNLY